MILYAGTAWNDITPPAGSLMAAFPERPAGVRRASGTLDPVRAKALALRGEKENVILVSADLCGIRKKSVERMRTAICRQISGIQPDHILIAATHTHAGPETLFLFGATPNDKDVLNIENSIIDAAVRAWKDMTPVQLKIGTKPIYLNHNRRKRDGQGRMVMSHEYAGDNPAGPVDPELTTLAFITPEGTVKSVVFHYTAHALTLGNKNKRFSSDYPGYAERIIEKNLPGSLALFLNGAAGNIHPRQCMRSDTSALEAIGTALGQATLESLASARLVDDCALALASERLSFTNRIDPSLSVPVEITVLRIGSFLMGFVPGEFFVEFQMKFKDQIKPVTGTLTGYANGWPGYVPVATAYAEGGYGVDACSTDPPEYSRTALPSGAGEQILNRLLELTKHCRE